jgi:type I restriction enzyme M protein
LKDRKSIENKSYLATYDEVKDNDYNISVNSYLKTNTDDNNIDIEEVNKMIAEIVSRQQQIRKELDAIIKELEDDYHE